MGINLRFFGVEIIQFLTKFGSAMVTRGRKTTTSEKEVLVNTSQKEAAKKSTVEKETSKKAQKKSSAPKKTVTKVSKKPELKKARVINNSAKDSRKTKDLYPEVIIDNLTKYQWWKSSGKSLRKSLRKQLKKVLRMKPSLEAIY